MWSRHEYQLLPQGKTDKDSNDPERPDASVSHLNSLLL
jgi:hypothetical protein